MDKFCQWLAANLDNTSLEMENREEYRDAAIMIPLVEKQGEWHILFEVRSLDLKWQPGEICFPGGRIEASDESPDVTAVRETCEELGVTVDKITLLGNLNYIVSQIGVIVHPFIGILEDTDNLQLNEMEVAEVFTVPLQYFQSTNPIEATMEFGTRPLAGFPFHLLPQYSEGWNTRGRYPLYFYQYGQYVIWGLTARILYSFLYSCKKYK
jgi:8-oxo-dGTP pyrophosphatase MutT (NUDIX family)